MLRQAFADGLAYARLERLTHLGYARQIERFFDSRPLVFTDKNSSFAFAAGDSDRGAACVYLRNGLVDVLAKCCSGDGSHVSVFLVRNVDFYDNVRNSVRQ